MTDNRMINHLTDDPQLSQSVKQEVRQQLETRFRDGLFLLGLRYLYQNKTEDAKKVQQVLDREFKRRFQAGLLQAAIVAHKVIGPVWAFACWSFCRSVLIRLKIFGLFTRRTKSSEQGSLDATQYLKFLQLPGHNAVRQEKE